LEIKPTYRMKQPRWPWDDQGVEKILWKSWEPSSVNASFTRLNYSLDFFP